MIHVLSPRALGVPTSWSPLLKAGNCAQRTHLEVQTKVMLEVSRKFTQCHWSWSIKFYSTVPERKPPESKSSGVPGCHLCLLWFSVSHPPMSLEQQLLDHDAPGELRTREMEGATGVPRSRPASSRGAPLHSGTHLGPSRVGTWLKMSGCYKGR